MLDEAGRVAGLVLEVRRGEAAAILPVPELLAALRALGAPGAAPAAGAAPLPPDRQTEAARAATLRILCWD